MQAELKIIHLQLTRKCNLHCRFCGQDHHRANELELREWINILEQLHDYAPGARIFLWGGEPLLYQHFPEVVSVAGKFGFSLELVTNGTRIIDHADLLKHCFKRIYLSIDGPENIHDAIRGRGVFAQVRDNLAMLGTDRPEIVMMSVMAPENLQCFKDLPFGLPVDRVILHEMIYLTESECAGLNESAAGKWLLNADERYPSALADAVDRLREITFPLPVEFQPHFASGCCREPFRHLHITSDGETSFCTDFTHYTLGNVRQFSLKEIFEGKKAQSVRLNGNQPFCSHCSWKNTEKTIVRFNNINP